MCLGGEESRLFFFFAARTGFHSVVFCSFLPFALSVCRGTVSFARVYVRVLGACALQYT